MKNKEIRVSFTISEELHEKSKGIPWGIRAAILRTLLEKVIAASKKHGLLVYGAILEGEYDIIPRSK